MYFVHSYAPDDRRNAIATCHYGEDVVAAAAAANVWATQFHPEKSGRNGLRLLANFVEACKAAALGPDRRATKDGEPGAAGLPLGRAG